MQRNLFLKLNKQIYCSIDEWIGLNIAMIRDLEDDVKTVLEDRIKSAGAVESPNFCLSDVSHVSK